MNLYEITVVNHSDNTSIFRIIQSKEELNSLNSIADSITQTSKYTTMEIKEIDGLFALNQALLSIFNYEDMLKDYFLNVDQLQARLDEEYSLETINCLTNQKELLNSLGLDLILESDTQVMEYLLVKNENYNQFIRKAKKLE